MSKLQYDVSGPELTESQNEARKRIAAFLEALEKEYGVYITIVHAGNGKINVTLYADNHPEELKPK